MPQSLPPMPQGLEARWLTEALRVPFDLAEGVTVADVRREPVGEGVGMMSELCRLHLNYSGAAPRAQSSIIAKYPSQNATNRGVAMSYHLYEREVRYFLELDPQTDAVTPEIYRATLDGDNFVILMEDLNTYRTGDQIVGADLRDTQVAVDALAKLHAAFWGSVSAIEWVPHVAASYHAQNMCDLVDVGWKAMSGAFDSVLTDEVAGLGERFKAALPRLQRYMDADPVTLVHGDFRMENLMYGQASGHHDVAIIDWQGPLLGRGMQDVALFLGQSTQTEVRRAHEADLIGRYLDGLAAQGVGDYTFEQAWLDYRMACLHNWSYVAVVSGTLDSSNARAFAWMSQMVARQVAATEDLALIELMP